jgi:formylglycine-generating enzyme required for sulfatase activity
MSLSNHEDLHKRGRRLKARAKLVQGSIYFDAFSFQPSFRCDMADIFISYSRADRDRVEPLAAALQAEGWSIWWDTRLRAGEQWDDVIEREIKAARCVLVVWSATSVTRQWVKEEARFGLSRGILVPVRIDAVDPPLGFTSIQAADLTDWAGGDGVKLRQLIDDVRAKIGAPDGAAGVVREVDWTWFDEEKAKKPPGYMKVALGVAAVAALAGLAIWRPWGSGAPPAPVSPVTVRPVQQPRTPIVEPEQPRLSALNPSRANVPLSAAELAALKQKDEFQECTNCPRMVVLPQGSFTMGSPNDEPERYSDEGPQHTVTFANPFAAGKYAVTFAEWDACAADGGCGGGRPDDNGRGRGDRPVINVSWNQAKAYTVWLSKKTGASYRLLSEAEREYVARAGATTPFWWGSSITPDQANYDGNYVYGGGGSKGEFRRKTLPVKWFQPNAWGLYQVHGNVWEWTEDCWNGSYTGAPEDGSAWTTGDCRQRVLRGGSWFLDPKNLRAANRGKGNAGYRDDNIGFRVARTLHP